LITIFSNEDAGSGGSVRNFILYLALVFAGLFAAVSWKAQRDQKMSSIPVLKVFGSSSFISQWGPGPWLKEEFEKTCECRVEFLDGADSTILFQRLKVEGRSGGADVVLGFDQFDLEMIQQGFDWKPIDSSGYDFFPEVSSVVNLSPLIPYNWSVLAFVFKKSENSSLPNRLDDLLKPELKGKISLQDPRTSSPGLQFLLWLIRVKGEEEAFSFVRKLQNQVSVYAPSWSGAYGQFTKGQALTTFSYVTSPVYHFVEEKNQDVVAAEFIEGHPIQYEFVGVPGTCKNCDLAQKFVKLLLSPVGQKIIMEKNYMFPALRGIKEGTPFASVPKYKTLTFEAPTSAAERERILKRWSVQRRGD